MASVSRYRKAAHVFMESLSPEIKLKPFNTQVNGASHFTRSPAVKSNGLIMG
ncbi:hypothetical protein Pla110_00610 [Polystyrenella longa]|uniref:Uncharacterized protein n=1 Tax=Polystyrenella longa TaxID=2528007 RepID=A0A518CGL2_9PLAN|nr:hypothetical protein Pla110_00610 [Polystyrenella longa]